MKKVLAIAVCAVTMLSGCGTYAGQGAHTGAGFGSILGSAIGGISGGPRGSNIGTIVGMAGGAVVGAAVGSAADKSKQKQLEQYQQQRYGVDDARAMDDSGFDPNHGGDDRIVFDDSPSVQVAPNIVIRNVDFSDKNGDGVIESGEECSVSFEIINRSSQPINDITPMVTETTGNKRIFISPSVRVESIMPSRGIRYTATVMGGKKLKDGNAVIKLSVAHGSTELSSPVRELKIETRKI